MEEQLTEYAQALQMFARLAQLAVDFGVPVETAINKVARNAIADADDVKHRRGWYALSLTSEQCEAHLFYGQVGVDVLSNIPRPSVGYCRDYVRQLMPR